MLGMVFVTNYWINKLSFVQARKAIDKAWVFLLQIAAADFKCTVAWHGSSLAIFTHRGT